MTKERALMVENLTPKKMSNAWGSARGGGGWALLNLAHTLRHRDSVMEGKYCKVPHFLKKSDFMISSPQK